MAVLRPVLRSVLDSVLRQVTVLRAGGYAAIPAGAEYVVIDGVQTLYEGEKIYVL